MEAEALELAEQIARRFPEARLLGCSLEWASQNPSVDEPLVLDCRDDPSLYWFRGYFYDFPFVVWNTREAQLNAMVDFLTGFFGERILCGVHLENDRIAGGGPVWLDAPPSDKWGEPWWINPKVTIRSWRGTHDQGSAGD